MASLDGAKIQKGKVGANALAVSDGVSGLLAAAPAAANLPIGTVKGIYNLVDAENLGITPAYDKTNDVNVYRHINEFYRLAGEGTKLYILLADQATTLVEMCESANDTLCKALITEAEGTIRQIALSVNPTGVTTMLNGMPADVYNVIAKAQLLYKWADDNFMSCNILLEGYDFGGNGAASADLRAIENVAAPNVSVVIGQDFNYASGLVDNAKKMADVGTALGTVSAAAINQNIGDNESFNLTDGIKGKWLVAGLSNNKTIKSQLSHLQTLDDKGYLFGTTYPPMAGVRWNNDHTCVEIIQDAEGNINEHTIAYGRTHDKARRLLRNALLPKVKTKQPVDKSGKLPTGVIKYFENLGDTVFADMETATEISSGKTSVDPNSDLITAKELIVKFQIVPYGTVVKINGTSNLKNSI
ncbi:MAG: DUF2586 family protein [Polaribacter sp.]|uniref:DUF2586 family protein n=1 Tax=Polaribacter sp. TaxID=1920175 RepID=UPI002F3514B5